MVINGIRFQPGGYNTMVNCDNSRALKVITGARPNGQNFTIDEAKANEIREHLYNYVAGLLDLNIRIPETRVEVVKIDGGQFAVLIRQPCIGPDQTTSPPKTKGAARRLAQQMRAGFVDKLYCRTNHRPGGLFRFGADPKVSNFCHNGDNSLWLVDVCPPRLWVTSGSGEKPMVEMFALDEERQGIEVWKHFTPAGVLVNTLTQLGALSIAHWDIFKGELGFPDQLLEIDIQGLQPNVYQARLLACELGWQYGIHQSELKAFFDKTHFERKLGPKQWAAIKAELLAWRG